MSDTEQSESTDSTTEQAEQVEAPAESTDSTTEQAEQVEAPAESTDAPADDTTPAPADDAPADVSQPRRLRGALETDIKRVTDAFMTGQITVENDLPFTPHRIAEALKQLDGLDDAPSGGAVTNVLRRWVEYGFIEVSEKPFAFVGYTDAARSEGLSALQAKYKAAKAAAKAAAAPAPAPAPAEQQPAADNAA